MQPVAQHTLVVAALFILVFFTRNIGSSLPAVSPSQNQTNQQRSREIESEVAHWSVRLKSSDEEERRDAAMMLSRLESNAATSALAGALTDPSPRVRAAASAGLAERPDPSVAPLLAARVTQEKDAFVRKTLAYSLGKFRGPERTGALIAALKDKNPEVRGAAAVGLGDHPDPDALAALMTALSDKNPFVRAQAARALGVNGSAAAQAIPALTKLLTSDDDGEARRQAATALGRIGDRSALPALEHARHDKDPYLAQAALDAIKAIEGKK
jgi:HEAT repeat protein